MIITDVEVRVFRTTTRRHSDSAGHAHPGPAHQVEQAMLTIRTKDGHEGHSFTAPEIVRHRRLPLVFPHRRAGAWERS